MRTARIGLRDSEQIQIRKDYEQGEETKSVINLYTNRVGYRTMALTHAMTTSTPAHRDRVQSR